MSPPYGMQLFLKEIFPIILSRIPVAHIYIVGSNPSKEVRSFASQNVIVTGYVEDVRPYLNKATVAMTPLLIGSGTRLKVLEAMSMKTPVVSTGLGCEGLDVFHEHSILAANTPGDFAQATIRLLHDASLRGHLVHNAYETVRTMYDWKTIGMRLQHIFKQLHTDERQQNVITNSLENVPQ